MAKWGKTDYREFEKLQKNIQKYVQRDLDAFIRKCVNELAWRVYSLAIKGTPVGEDTADPGNLRRNWNASGITKNGRTYEIEIFNPVEYASYVEFGHRTRNGEDWVEGRFMLTKAEITVESKASGILDKKIEEYLREVVLDVD